MFLCMWYDIMYETLVYDYRKLFANVLNATEYDFTSLLTGHVCLKERCIQLR